MNLIGFYTFIIILTLLVYPIAFYLIKRIFNYRSDRSKSATYPIIKGLTVLITAYLARFGVGKYLFDGFVATIDSKIDSELSIVLSLQQSNSNFWIDFAFYTLVTIIIVLYTFMAYSRKRLETIAEKDLKKEFPEIEIPESSYKIIPIFHERIQYLFELKYEKEKLLLEYDSVYNVLFGSFNQGLHCFLIMIYCLDKHNSNLENIEFGINNLDEVYNKINGDNGKTEILERYVIFENEIIDKKKLDENSIVISESRLLNELIDFSTYLKDLIDKFRNSKLPFSNLEQAENFPTLHSTFIKSDYSIGTKRRTKLMPLDIYIDKWLSEDSVKHLVILGDYGMGKSTFQRFYAAKLAEKILGGTNTRFPVFISLTNTSPRHGGIQNAIGRFVADNLGVSSKLFDELVNRGKILFILDGFDEMGFIGTHSQRIKQLNAIWKLATKNNKILISGRPSYFPNEKELKIAFNIKERTNNIPQETPYFERVFLQPFDKEKIHLSLKKYYKPKQVREYFSFIINNKSIYELCQRPSLMHIVREMLPTLFIQEDIEHLSSRTLIKEYVTHWIERQTEKNIEGAVDNISKKDEFIYSFFKELAAEYYVRNTTKLPSDDILEFLNQKINLLNFSNREDIEGFESEVLTAYFVEIENDEYRYVHKSFMEFFVAERILELLKNREFKNPLINQVDWSEEIINFVYESDDFDENKIFNKKFPLLLCLTSNNKIMTLLNMFAFKIKAYLYNFTYIIPNAFIGISSLPSFNIKKETYLIEKLVKSIEELEDDEFFKLDIDENRVKRQVVKIKENYTAGKVNVNNIVKLIDIIEPTIYFTVNSRVNGKNKLGIVPKAYYIAFLKHQLPVKGNRYIIDYLKYRYNKRLKITKHNKVYKTFGGWH